MADYILVHGAWCGAWAFERTAKDLRAAGHRVLVADLTGLGSRQQEFHPGITLSTHIDDVVGQVNAAGFDRFILVGHSWGGMVITGVATKMGGQIDALVYIDAFLPGDGQAVWDLTSEWEHGYYIDSQKHAPAAVPPLPGLAHPAMTPQPLLTFLEGVRFTGEETKVPRKTYISATDWQPSPFGQFAQKVEGDPAWSYHTLPCSHDVMSDQPEQLLAILLDQV
jgi:pimeloyl-ACP methyl ester carboxylesterase